MAGLAVPVAAAPAALASIVSERIGTMIKRNNNNNNNKSRKKEREQLKVDSQFLKLFMKVVVVVVVAVVCVCVYVIQSGQAEKKNRGTRVRDHQLREGGRKVNNKKREGKKTRHAHSGYSVHTT